MVGKVLELVVVICLGGFGLCIVLSFLGMIIEMIKGIFD